MTSRGFLAVSALALALAACGKKSETADQTVAASDAAVPSAPAAAVSPGQAFANAAASSDAFEIETSKLAVTKAASDKTKKFAESMIKAHTDSTAKLKAAAAQAVPAITPDPALTPDQQQKLDALRAASGADFDKAYMAAQVEAHQMTLDKLKAYAASGDVAPLKAFAGELVPVVTAHLNMAKGM